MMKRWGERGGGVMKRWGEGGVMKRWGEGGVIKRWGEVGVGGD